MSSEQYDAIKKEGYLLAGELGDLNRRAWVYRQMYRHSGKRNVFALIAAHGALWAAGYMRKGRYAANVLSLAYLLKPDVRRARLAAVAQFTDRILDINRQVCAQSYALYHYTERHGGDAFIRSVIGDRFADLLCECHASNRNNTPYGAALREQLFLAFFNWEQQHIVAPAVTVAFDEFDWPWVRQQALRTELDFRYFGKGFCIRFDNFASKEERLGRGVQAYHRAEEVGLDQVERALERYKPVRAPRMPSLLGSGIAHPSIARIADL